MKSVLVFLDGIGLGDADAEYNPFLSARLPALHELLGVDRVTRQEAGRSGTHASLAAVDATLGFEGTPQSGTGQASLLTGRNAVALHGKHFGPWVPSKLQELVREESLLRQAQRAGLSAAFANAYPEEATDLTRPAAVPSDAAARSRRRVPSFLRAGPPLAALGAGLLTRHTAELERGDAVASEITNDGWRHSLGRTSVPAISAADAGRNLVRIAEAHDLTLFAHYATDYAGHTQDMHAAVQSLERVDAFIGAVAESMSQDMLVIVISDHGNIEDVRTNHTRNPAFGMVLGRGHEAVAAKLRSLTDVAPAIAAALQR